MVSELPVDENKGGDGKAISRRTHAFLSGDPGLPRLHIERAIRRFLRLGPEAVRVVLSER